MTTVELLETALSGSGIANDINQIKKVCSETNTKLNMIFHEVESLKAENVMIKNGLERIKVINAELQSKINDLDQYGRKNDLIVRNVPLEDCENLYSE